MGSRGYAAAGERLQQGARAERALERGLQQEDERGQRRQRRDPSRPALLELNQQEDNSQEKDRCTRIELERHQCILPRHFGAAGTQT